MFLSFFLAGLLAARKSRRVSSSLLAGVVVGGVFLILDLFVGNLLFDYLITFPQLMSQIPPFSASELANYEGLILVNTVPYSLIAGLVLVAVGALVGAMGGLAWKRHVPVGVLIGLIVGWIFLIGGLCIGGYVLYAVISMQGQNAQMDDLTSSVLIFGAMVLIGIGTIAGAIYGLRRRKKEESVVS